MKHIALFGGTFDPVHFGHLETAESVGEVLGIDEILLMTAGDPPHKPFGVLPAVVRHEMVRAAVEGKARLKASSLEIDHGLSHTIDAVKIMHRLLAEAGTEASISFITSAEYLCPANPSVITGWHQADELLSLVNLIVVPRKDCSYQKARRWARQLKIPNVQIVNLPGSDVSSGLVRAAVKNKSSLHKLVPPAVADIILSRGYYR
jgi:nicotinate-nucleotide adenylyltransferase